MSEAERAGGAPERRAERAFARREPIMRKVCRRMAAGASLAEVCRDPMLPQAQDICRWASEEPRFARMLAEARSAGGTSHLARPGRAGGWSDEAAQEFLARIAAGRGLAEVCAEPDMPTHTTICRWLKARDGFADAYREARDMQADLLFDLAWLIARQATEDTVRVSRLMVDTIKWRCRSLAPKVYGTPRNLRVSRGEEGRDDEGPLTIRVRQFEKSADGKSVVEVFPETPRTITMPRTRRD